MAMHSLQVAATCARGRQENTDFVAMLAQWASQQQEAQKQVERRSREMDLLQRQQEREVSSQKDDKNKNSDEQRTQRRRRKNAKPSDPNAWMWVQCHQRGTEEEGGGDLEGAAFDNWTSWVESHPNSKNSRGVGDAEVRIAWLPSRATPMMIAAAAGQHETLQSLLAIQDAAPSAFQLNEDETEEQEPSSGVGKKKNDQQKSKKQNTRSLLGNLMVMQQEAVTGSTVGHIAAANKTTDPEGRCMQVLREWWTNYHGASSLPDVHLLTIVGKGLSPIHTAAANLHVGALRQLVAALGPSVILCQAKGGWAASHFACSTSTALVAAAPETAGGDTVTEYRDECAEFLSQLVTALNQQQQENHGSGAKMLIEQTDARQRSSLHLAARRGSVLCLEALLLPLLAETKEEENSERQKRDRSAELSVRQLQQLVAAIHLKDSQGTTPIHVAAFGGHVHLLRWIVDRCFPSGVNVEQHEEPPTLTIRDLLGIQDCEGKTPQGYATSAKQKNIDTVEYLESLLGVEAVDFGGEDAEDRQQSTTYRVSNERAKRWQRSVFTNEARAALKKAAGTVHDAQQQSLVIFLLDDASMGRLQTQSGDSAAKSVDINQSSCASCAGDMVLSGLLASQENQGDAATLNEVKVELVIPNPDPKAIERIAADVEFATKQRHTSETHEVSITKGKVKLLPMLSGEALKTLVGSEAVVAIWLDYCDSIDKGTNRDDLLVLFSEKVLCSSAPHVVVALTFSWRGAGGSRQGQPKEGLPYLKTVGSKLEKEVVDLAGRFGWHLERSSQPFLQQGQLFFGVYNFCKSTLEEGAPLTFREA